MNLPHLSGFIVKEYSQTFSNWRATKSLDAFLKENNIPAVTGIDTRALTKHTRSSGAMKGVISTEDFDIDSLIFSVQYHPESSPGPHDEKLLFKRFIDLMKSTK